MIVLTTALWDRPAVESIIIDYYAEMFPDYERVAVYSEETPGDLIGQAHRRDWRLVEGPSQPLARKLNCASRYIGEKIAGVSKIVTFGSDDLIHPYAMEQLLDVAEEEDCVGFRGAYFVHPDSWRACHFEYAPPGKIRPTGAGKCLSRKVLDDCEWILRDDETVRYMDGAMEKRLAERGYSWHVIPHEKIRAPVLDIKTERNLSTYQHLVDAGATEVDADELVAMFGDCWAQRIRALR